MRQTALITGASGGIGLQLAEEFASHDSDLIVVARRQTELDALAGRCRELHGVRVHVRPMDLLAPDASAKLVQQLEDDGLAVDVLVNNAGLHDLGAFVEIDLTRHERLMQLNMIVLTMLTRRLLPLMLARGRGRILNVASTASFQPVPSQALYAASKAFVLSLSESLCEELRGSGVTVTALCPGLTKTDMYDRAYREHESLRYIPGLLLSDARDVAREGYEACMAGRAVVVPGLANRATASVVQLLPRWMVRSVAGLVGRDLRNE